MKRVFLDVNVFLDFVFSRPPFYTEIWQIISMARRKEIICDTNPNCFPHSFHMLMKIYKDEEQIKHNFALLRKTVDVSAFDAKVLDSALSMTEPKDLEDAVIYQLALSWEADIFLTRDRKGFSSKQMEIMSPRQFLAGWDF